MPYVIDTAVDRLGAGQRQLEAIIVLVGCGGTGGFLAEAICRRRRRRRRTAGDRCDARRAIPERVALA